MWRCEVRWISGDLANISLRVYFHRTYSRNPTRSKVPLDAPRVLTECIKSMTPRAPFHGPGHEPRPQAGDHRVGVSYSEKREHGDLNEIPHPPSACRQLPSRCTQGVSRRTPPRMGTNEGSSTVALTFLHITIIQHTCKTEFNWAVHLLKQLMAPARTAGGVGNP